MVSEMFLKFKILNEMKLLYLKISFKKRVTKYNLIFIYTTYILYYVAWEKSFIFLLLFEITFKL